MSDDPRVQAARYRLERAARDEAAEAGEHAPATDAAAAASGISTTSPQASARSGESAHAGAPTAHERAMYVEVAIQQAIRRGEFDDLPGAGKPLEGLGDHHDPDWWIRRKIQTEKLTGLGPPALLLRTEHAEFEERADALTRESDVRDYVADFNRRVIDARRQLQGGPPVVTPTRDPDAEAAAWRARRDARAAAASADAGAGAADAESARRRLGWRRRAGGRRDTSG